MGFQLGSTLVMSYYVVINLLPLKLNIKTLPRGVAIRTFGIVACNEQRRDKACLQSIFALCSARFVAPVQRAAEFVSAVVTWFHLYKLEENEELTTGAVLLLQHWHGTNAKNHQYTSWWHKIVQAGNSKSDWRLSQLYRGRLDSGSPMKEGFDVHSWCGNKQHVINFWSFGCPIYSIQLLESKWYLLWHSIPIILFVEQSGLTIIISNETLSLFMLLFMCLTLSLNLSTQVLSPIREATHVLQISLICLSSILIVIFSRRFRRA